MLTFYLDEFEINSDWFRASRLLSKDTKEVKEKLARMDEIRLISVEELE